MKEIVTIPDLTLTGTFKLEQLATTGLEGKIFESLDITLFDLCPNCQLQQAQTTDLIPTWGN